MSTDSESRRFVLDLEKLSKAIVRYDEATDTLYLVLSDEEPDETLLLENDIVVRIRGNEVIGITIRGISSR